MSDVSKWANHASHFGFIDLIRQEAGFMATSGDPAIAGAANRIGALAGAVQFLYSELFPHAVEAYAAQQAGSQAAVQEPAPPAPPVAPPVPTAPTFQTPSYPIVQEADTGEAARTAAAVAAALAAHGIGV